MIPNIVKAFGIANACRSAAPLRAIRAPRFDLPNASTYKMTIYNITGQVVEQQSGYSEAGTVYIGWNASDKASGIYFYHLQAGEHVETMKMLLLK